MAFPRCRMPFGRAKDCEKICLRGGQRHRLATGLADPEPAQLQSAEQSMAELLCASGCEDANMAGSGFGGEVLHGGDAAMGCWSPDCGDRAMSWSPDCGYGAMGWSPDGGDGGDGGDCASDREDVMGWSPDGGDGAMGWSPGAAEGAMHQLSH